jgi:peptide chain release factor 3
MNENAETVRPNALAKSEPAAPLTTPEASGSRRTFAIISHPDAGKTTLTEKLLLEAGAIRMAGHVRARGERRRTRSDWMEIEQKRGISVTSSVITFEYRGLTFNLLDTPGHSDFSEDTYRTLTAVDSAVMVLDAAKGIEAQTLKLFEVCRLRDIPIITFINKVDREGLDPLELLDEIGAKLALDVAPVSWPLGMGTDFRGCLDLSDGRITLADGKAPSVDRLEIDRLAENHEMMADRVYGPALESLQIVRSSLPGFDLASYREGHQTPVLFGSALKSLGVQSLLDAIADWAPAPRPQPADPEPVSPGDDKVVGFVFKVQANMDPNHRDRIAFLRLCSAKFRRGMKLHNVRSGRDLTVGNPVFFFAQDRELAEEAVAGDVVGIPNHGTLSVGDTLTEGESVQVSGIPSFAPEILRNVRTEEALKAKQLGKALNDLAEEGVVQLFRKIDGLATLVGVVGPLQLDVLAARLASEYGVKAIVETSQFETARWVSGDSTDLERFKMQNRHSLAEDRTGALVFLARLWDLQHMVGKWPTLRFAQTKEISNPTS